MISNESEGIFSKKLNLINKKKYFLVKRMKN
jgi:hypothetical protein